MYTRAVSRNVRLEVDLIPGLRALLDKWKRARGDVKPDASFYALHGQRSFPAKQVNAWFKLVLGHLEARPPAGEVWTGHSLRKGAATAAAGSGLTTAETAGAAAQAMKAVGGSKQESAAAAGHAAAAACNLSSTTLAARLAPGGLRL